MPEWLQALIEPALSGAVMGLMLLGGLRQQVNSLKESLTALAASVTRAHTRIDDHIDRHHVRVRAGQ